VVREKAQQAAAAGILENVMEFRWRSWRSLTRALPLLLGRGCSYVVIFFAVAA
jgi:hypothetical protein